MRRNINVREFLHFISYSLRVSMICPNMLSHLFHAAYFYVALLALIHCIFMHNLKMLHVVLNFRKSFSTFFTSNPPKKTTIVEVHDVRKGFFYH
jgi:hypothetical protein